MAWRPCKIHPECRKVRGTGHVLEEVRCPWCGYPISTSTPHQWCANCYVMFRLDGKFIHFSVSHPKTEAECFARALAKSGGARIGRKPPPEPVTDANGHAHAWEYDAPASDFHTARYVCYACGARGWRERGEMGKEWTWDRPIKEYKAGSKRAKRRFEPEPEVEVTRKPRSAGRNRTGGYLPPSSGGKR